MKSKVSKFILGFSLSFSCITFSISPVNYLVSKLNNKILYNSLKSSKNTKSLNDDVRLSYINNNDDYETPNGVARIINNSVIVFNSWFNNEVWRYDIKAENTIVKTFFKSNIESLSDVKLKYNSYNNTFLVYGSVNTNRFIIQINADDGSEFKVNNNTNNSIWSTQLINGISNLVIDENNGNIIVIPSYQDFSNPASTWIAKFSSITYSSVWYKFSSLASNLTYNANNSIPVAFSVDENTWGFTHFIKGTNNNVDKYMYLLFDYNLNFVAKSNEISLVSTSNKLHTDKIITTPLIFPFQTSGIKKYKIVDTSIAPIYTLDSFNNDLIVDGSSEIRLFTFTPKNGSTNATIIQDNQMTTDYISYQLKKDSKNNAFYISGFGKQSDSKIDYSKNKIIGYKVDKTSGSVTAATNVLDDTYTNQKAITNISIINDENNKETKTALVKEVKMDSQVLLHQVLKTIHKLLILFNQNI